MHDLALAQELDGLAHIRVIAQAQDVVVGHARLLLRSQILVQVCHHVTLDADVLHVKGNAGGSNGVYAGRVIHKVGRIGALGDLLLGHAARQLVQDRGDHLEVGEFLGTHRSIGNVPFF